MKRACLVILGVVVCLAPAHGQTAEEKKAALAYLQSLQTKDGGFLPFRPNPATDVVVQPTLRATSAAVRAFKYFGGEMTDRKGAARFVASCFDKDSGGFSDQPGGKPDVFTTAVGIMAVTGLEMPAEPYTSGVVRYLAEYPKTFEDIRIAAAGLERLDRRPAKAADWLKEVEKLRNPDGTYGKGAGLARMTGSAAVVVLRLGGKLEQPDNVLKAIKAGQRGDGGFGKEDVETSDLETSYRVLRAFVMLKQKPDRPDALRAFVGRCRNRDGGYGVAPGQPSNVGATYFASIILYWLAEK
jgi:hypothetical protein